MIFLFHCVWSSDMGTHSLTYLLTYSFTYSLTHLLTHILTVSRTCRSVLTEVALSGFASIYFEKVVKSTKEVITIWERNFQLGLFHSLTLTHTHSLLLTHSLTHSYSLLLTHPLTLTHSYSLAFKVCIV